MLRRFTKCNNLNATEIFLILRSFGLGPAQIRYNMVTTLLTNSLKSRIGHFPRSINMRMINDQ